MLWRKHWTADSISAADDTFIPALLAIVQRHPDYLDRHEWRAGMARDVARHLLQQFVRGHFGQVGRDLRRLGAAFGAGATLSLFAAGVGEMIRRALRPGRAIG